MTSEQILGLGLAMLVMLLGIIGSVVPGLPSTPLVLVGAIGHRIYFQENSAANWVLIVMVLIAVFALLLDYLAAMFGAKKLGATWKGVLGAAIGGLIGLFFGLPGILVGPFLGAITFELATGRKFHDSARAGVGATLGLLAGAVGKIACCLAMTGLFAVNVIARSMNT